jgi:hypothetical protein
LLSVNPVISLAFSLLIIQFIPFRSMEITLSTVMAVIRDQLAAGLIGQDPRQVAVLNGEIDRRVMGNPMARGVLDMALMDLDKLDHCTLDYYCL